MYCLDTNIVIALFRADITVQKKITTLQQAGIPISITMFSVAELFKGAYKASRQEEALQLVREFIKSVDILPFTERSCELFGRDQNFLQKKGKIAPEIDLLIGCVAKAEDYILITRNKKDFENIPDLRLETW